MTLPLLPQDKANHVLYGLAVFCVFGLVSPVYGLAAAVAVGALKEAYDSQHKESHTPDIWDFVATAAGGLLGFYCTFL